MIWHNFFEDATNDLNQIKIANDIYQRIRGFLHSRFQDSFERIKKWTEGETEHTEYLLNLATIPGIPEQYTNLLILLTTKRHHHYAGVYKTKGRWDLGSRPLIELYLKDPNTPVKQFEEMSKIFTHEFTHYLDDKRIKIELGNAKKPYVHDEGTFERQSEYYNNQVEFNAYYIEGIRNILEDMDNKLRSRQEFPLDFKQFLYDWSIVEKYFHSEFRTLLDPFWRKKFIKRLYQFHKLLVDRYRSGKQFDKVWKSFAIKYAESQGDE